MAIKSPSAVQIIADCDHKPTLQIKILNQILGADNIKDHDVVLIAIAGALRQGKSFLLNFFLKYLYAQYERNDVTDWIGENDNDNTKLEGFNWRGGQNPETVGMWIWSDIFTHQFHNGDKVAIILMDSQGIFDSDSSFLDCIRTFAITTMISSVQLFNLMQQIQEDHLNQLNVFMEYGLLFMEQSDEKPFQELLFLIRDWPYEYENPYGYSPQYIEKVFSTNEKQTLDSQELRDRIQSYFDQIKAFLMPHPGKSVARQQDFNGEIKNIDVEFVTYLKELVPSILAPEKLVVKKINGQKLHPRDVIKYLEMFVRIFNDDTLPEPKSMLTSIAEISNHMLHKKCLEEFSDSMKSIIEHKFSNEWQEPCFTPGNLKQLMVEYSDRAFQQFDEKHKLGGDEMIETFRNKLHSEINCQKLKFESENLKHYVAFCQLADKELEITMNDCFALYKDNMRKQFQRLNSEAPYYKESELNELHNNHKREALNKYETSKKRGYKILHYKTQLMDYINKEFKSFKDLNTHKQAEYYVKKGVEWLPTVAGLAASALYFLRK